MIGDPDRGGAWTRAFLGLRARELHVCGGMEGVEVIRQLCQQVSISYYC
jgi:ATP-dependent RNA helicase SUPV3L1/SUV3